jgi:formamidopyrimidine-DNA glycosylase
VPELPEVETIRRELTPLLTGRRILGVSLDRPDIVGWPGADRFAAGVKGRRVDSLDRKGKYLIVRLDRGKELVFHLRLSGHLEVIGARERPRFERARFRLDNGRVLSFVEPRVLGKVHLVEAGNYPARLAGMSRMGHEPIGVEFTADYLRDKLAGRKAAVKSLLLDQRVCCGVGNIYSDEALFRAGVRPTRPAGRVTRPEIARLAAALRRVLEDGIRWCGTTLGDGRYVRPGTQQGSFQRRLNVFGREGERCRRRGCKGVIERLKIGNRSSYFCPACQR